MPLLVPEVAPVPPAPLAEPVVVTLPLAPPEAGFVEPLVTLPLVPIPGFVAAPLVEPVDVSPLVPPAAPLPVPFEPEDAFVPDPPTFSVGVALLQATAATSAVHGSIRSQA
jgi:hypothetical protein